MGSNCVTVNCLHDRAGTFASLLYKDEMVSVRPSVRHAAYSVISACSTLNFVSVIAETSGISKFMCISF